MHSLNHSKVIWSRGFVWTRLTIRLDMMLCPTLQNAHAALAHCWPAPRIEIPLTLIISLITPPSLPTLLAPFFTPTHTWPFLLISLSFHLPSHFYLHPQWAQLPLWQHGGSSGGSSSLRLMGGPESEPFCFAFVLSHPPSIPHHQVSHVLQEGWIFTPLCY